MRIHIVGPGGSGKTVLAEALSQRLSVPCHAMDDMIWNPGAPGAKRPAKERRALLEAVILEKDWILEGMYLEEAEPAFAEADQILVLDLSPALCAFRVLKRSLAGPDRAHPKMVSAMVKRSLRYRAQELPRLEKLLFPYREKVRYIRSREDLQALLRS